MFSDVEAFALVYLMRSVSEERRSHHAREVVQQLDLDSRLEPLVPLPPKRRRLRRAYDEVLAAFVSVSGLPEPDRSRVIEEIFVAVLESNE